jgi:hypothetical protein
MNPQADIFDPIAEALDTATSVKSFFGAKHLAANGAPPRYVWVPTTGAFDGPREVGGYPRALTDVLMTFDVHCWAATFDGAWALVRNLVTAVRMAPGQKWGGAWYELGAVDALPSEASLRGWVLTVPISLRIPLLESDLDGQTYVPVTIESVVLDDSQGVDGDGTLTAPKS